MARGENDDDTLLAVEADLAGVFALQTAFDEPTYAGR